MFAVNNAWSLMGQQFEKYGYDYGYEYEGNQYFNDWMYYMDEIETNDGSYTPSEVDMEAMFDRTPPMLSVEGMTKTSNFTAGQLGTKPCGIKARVEAVQESLPCLLSSLSSKNSNFTAGQLGTKPCATKPRVAPEPVAEALPCLLSSLSSKASNFTAGQLGTKPLKTRPEPVEHGLLSSMPAEPLSNSTNFTAGQLGTNPGAPKARMAVPATEPMKVQLPAEARGLPELHPCLPAKKMPKFEKEFGAQKSLDPKMPVKKRLPESLSEASSRAIEEEPPVAR